MADLGDNLQVLWKYIAVVSTIYWLTFDFLRRYIFCKLENIWKWILFFRRKLCQFCIEWTIQWAVWANTGPFTGPYESKVEADKYYILIFMCKKKCPTLYWQLSLCKHQSPFSSLQDTKATKYALGWLQGFQPTAMCKTFIKRVEYPGSLD